MVGPGELEVWRREERVSREQCEERGEEQRGEDAERRLKTWFIIARTHHKVCAAFSQRLKEYDLTSAQHELLANLLLEDGLTQQEIAQRLFVTKGNVTGLVKRLEDRELIQRQADPGDARKNLVSLTERGREMARLSSQLQSELVEGVFGGFSAEQERELRSFMKILRQGVERYEAP